MRTSISISLHPNVLLEIIHVHALQLSTQLNPHTFYVIGRYLGCHIAVELKTAEPAFMTDGFVNITNVIQSEISPPLVRMNCRSWQNVVNDESVQCRFLPVWENEEQRSFRLVLP